MLRTVLSVIAGLVVAFAIVFASDALFHALVPSAAPPGDTSDREAMRAYVAGQPIGVLIALLAAGRLGRLQALPSRRASQGAAKCPGGSSPACSCSSRQPTS
jgi:hypothetical protein